MRFVFRLFSYFDTKFFLLTGQNGEISSLNFVFAGAKWEETKKALHQLWILANVVTFWQMQRSNDNGREFIMMSKHLTLWRKINYYIFCDFVSFHFFSSIGVTWKLIHQNWEMNQLCHQSDTPFHCWISFVIVKIIGTFDNNEREKNNDFCTETKEKWKFIFVDNWNLWKWYVWNTLRV